MTTVATTEDDSPAIGQSERGRVSISNTVVRKIAAKAAAENPDVGAPATRVLGISMPGVGGIGGHGSDLDGLPATTVEVDGAQAFITMAISVRWPRSVAGVVADVRSAVRDRVAEFTGLNVKEVNVTVADLVTDIPTPPRVR